MSLRQSDGDKLLNKVQPDFTKSESQQNKQHVQGGLDTAASYLPGQHKGSDHLDDHKRDKPLTHDTGRAGPLDQIKHAVKPNSSETLGDKAGRHTDNLASTAQPEENKGFVQKVMDTLNPSKDSHGHSTAHHASGHHA